MGGDGAAEDAAVAERKRRGRCAANGSYAALVPCATEDGGIGGEEIDGDLGVVVCFHDEVPFGGVVSRRCTRRGARQFRRG